MKNRFHLHRARQKSRRQVTLISKNASRKRCQGCGRTNYFPRHQRPPRKCDFCACYFSAHRKTWDQVRLDIILSGQVWGSRMHAELRRPLFFSEEVTRIPSSVGQLSRLQAEANRRISAFLEVCYPYRICGPTVFRELRGLPDLT